jgi:peptide/nickel transport system ATP-binding protein
MEPPRRRGERHLRPDVKEKIELQTSSDYLVKIQGLELRFYTYEGVVQALDGVGLQIRSGEILGVVGETGCGKSVTSLSIMGIVPPPGAIEGGKIVFNLEGKEIDLLKQKEDFLRGVRGRDISMVFQEPRAYLNPVYSVEDQVGEVLMVHRKQEFIKRALETLNKEELAKQQKRLEDKITKIEELIQEKKAKAAATPAKTKEQDKVIAKATAKRSKLLEQLKLRKEHPKPSFRMRLYKRWAKNPNALSIRFYSNIPLARRFQKPYKMEIRSEIVNLLKSLGIADPERVATMYPHELSGGMAQRVVIAMSLACNPKLMICDEPTTNLDVTVQAQILELIRTLRESFKSSILYITHDLGVIAELCERVAVMYAGNVVEVSDVMELFKKPLHPYTSALLASIPRPGSAFRSIPGMVPSLINPPTGCRFHDRCLYAMDTCIVNKPELVEVEKNHFAACHLYGGQ